MKIPSDFPVSAKQWFEQYCSEQRCGDIQRIDTVSGGSICTAQRVVFADDSALFIKSHHRPPPGLFCCEANGLEAIAATQSITTPAVYFYDEHCLILESIDEEAASPAYWQAFAEQLTQLHRSTSEDFGFRADNYCGTTPQPNPVTQDGYHFFAEQRLGYQGKLAREHNHFDARDLKQLESLCQKLPTLIPSQPASLIHGDLWSGNTLCGHNATPVLIDPAAHYGWREAEIAMTRLFGQFPPLFYETYDNCYPMENDWQSRIEIYNLYHLLNHLNLFGSGYYVQVKAILNRYS